MKGLREFISRLTWSIVDFPATYEPDQPDPSRTVLTAPSELANVLSSARTDLSDYHAVLLDLDIPAWLIPSTTEGHSHLYVDVACTWEAYLEFLRAAEKIGLVEKGYVDVSEQRGYTSLRMPGVKKT